MHGWHVPSLERKASASCLLSHSWESKVQRPLSSESGQPPSRLRRPEKDKGPTRRGQTAPSPGQDATVESHWVSRAAMETVRDAPNIPVPLRETGTEPVKDPGPHAGPTGPAWMALRLLLATWPSTNPPSACSRPEVGPHSLPSSVHLSPG